MRYQFLLIVEILNDGDSIDAPTLANEIQSSLEYERARFGIRALSVETLTGKAGPVIRQGFDYRKAISNVHSTGGDT